MYLVINLGLKSIRGIIFNKNGKKIYIKSFNIKTYIKDEFVEQNPQSYKKFLEKIFINIRDKKISKKIKYISTTTSASCLLLLNKKKKTISKSIMVLDGRTKNIADYYNKMIKSKKFSTDDQILKILWFQKKLKNKNILGHILNSGDYLNYLITNQIFTDRLNYNKIVNKKFEIIQKLNKKEIINKHFIPKPYEIGEIFELDRSLLKKYGFTTDTKFILTTYDAICATIGSANFKNPFNNISEVSGTVTSIRLITKNLPKIKNHNLKISSIPLLKIYIVGASSNLGGGLIGWIKDFFLKKVDFKILKKYYDRSKNNLIFLPFIFGDRYLEINPHNGASIFGLKRDSTIYDVVKSCILSTGFISKKYIDDLVQEGFKINTITLSGGLSRIKFINEIKSLIFKKKTFLCDEFESTSFGCFLIMKAKIEKLKFKDIIKMIKLKRIAKTKKEFFDYDYKRFIKMILRYKTLENETTKISQRNNYKVNL
jgi:sugar (pentulose or hexulose) kinase